MSNDRGQHRRLHVPRAGDLYVNGAKTAKGNVHQATKKVIARTDRRKVEAGEKAAVILANTADLDIDSWCANPNCKERLPAAGTVAYEPATGLAWHMGTGCRTATLD